MCESFPTFRLGRLAQAVDKASKHITATYDQSERILAYIAENKEDLDKAVAEAVCRSNLSNGAQVEFRTTVEGIDGQSSLS